MTKGSSSTFDVLRAGNGRESDFNLRDLDLLQEEHREECLAIVTAYLSQKAESLPKDGLFCAKESSQACRKSPFFNRCVPKISLRDYVHRIARFTSASSVCFVMAGSYIERMSQADESCQVTQQTVHRLLLCGVLLAAKLNDDKFRSNSFYSRVGGVSKAVMNEMEVSMFKSLGFSLHLSKQTIAAQLHKMVRLVEQNQGYAAINQESRRSKKRASEGVPENGIPSKLPHDDHHTEILVTESESHRSAKSCESIVGHQEQRIKEVSELLAQASGLLSRPGSTELQDDSDVDELATIQSLQLSNSSSSSLLVEDSSKQESDLEGSSNIPGFPDTCAKVFCQVGRVASGLIKFQECKEALV